MPDSMSVIPTDEPEIPDDVIARVSDYVDGVLPPDARAEVAANLERDPLWKRAHAEITGARDAISGLQKARPQSSFDQDVTNTIHKRSAGAFFGRRTFGDRVPFGALLIVALLALAAIVWVLHGSQTGSLTSPTPEPEGSGSARPSIAPRL